MIRRQDKRSIRLYMKRKEVADGHQLARNLAELYEAMFNDRKLAERKCTKDIVFLPNATMQEAPNLAGFCEEFSCFVS